MAELLNDKVILVFTLLGFIGLLILFGRISWTYRDELGDKWNALRDFVVEKFSFRRRGDSSVAEPSSSDLLYYRVEKNLQLMNQVLAELRQSAVAAAPAPARQRDESQLAELLTLLHEMKHHLSDGLKNVRAAEPDVSAALRQELLDFQNWMDDRHQKTLTKMAAELDGAIRSNASFAEEIRKDLHDTDRQLNMLLSRMSSIDALQNSLMESAKPPAQPARAPDRERRDKYDIFLSYSSRNQEEANEIFSEVTSVGGTVFLASKSLTPGDDFADEIKEALAQSTEVWMLVSPDSLKSDWVSSEWGAAWALGKKVVPIVHRCDPNGLPERISRRQCIDFYKFRDLVKKTFARA